MNILVTGFKGQLGFDILNELTKRNIKCSGVDINALDLTDENEVKNFLNDNKWTHIIHCAAYTDVDKAESCVDLCRKVNVDETRYLVEQCRKYNMPMMYFSTDYVYGGEGNETYKVGDQINPLDVYAKTKYKGELEIFKLDK